ncbi:MAG: hypothetical protein COU10_01690 [Candidatus Harrisonbacteria bacterium CG10_big_fil_rev_8_21_14_0_10_45_28]|uniref:Uncharacterized protein n=1 Tax=Candidatus Harrisonbacteria bacterium CG10_big_fil_rev_8_21_14_0_10_45_28 TaxID=1974586 RepID=A0A2H0UQB0_9BACT|nr:MAG: hypothetical protein COU10_01690 [Candidatus Harrisonbacteria bacterium CG10_big_fil_rev_8_21_14_0_10_45_28]
MEKEEKVKYNLLAEARSAEAINSQHPIGLHTVNCVRTIFEKQNEYIYIPDLDMRIQKLSKKEHPAICEHGVLSRRGVGAVEAQTSTTTT